MNAQEYERMMELRINHRKLRESHLFLRRLMAAVILHHETVVLNLEDPRIPTEPEILTHNWNGMTVVELSPVTPPRKKP